MKGLDLIPLTGISNNMIVILDNIRSLHNVGSIFRTADAVCAEKIYLCGITPMPVDRFGNLRDQLAKVALGAEKSVSWEHYRTTRQAILKAKKDGYKILVIEQAKNSIPYHKTPKGLLKNSKFALVVGNEVEGVPASVLKMADKVLEIPMRGQVVKQTKHPKSLGEGKESLNVSISFGVVAYHLMVVASK